MSSNSIMNSPVPAFSKDMGKKKRTNRLAKLKQCKFEAKREQWLSQVKNKGFKDESNVRSSPLMQSSHERDKLSSKDLETRSGGENSSLNDSDLEYLTNSPLSSVFGSQDSRKNHVGSISFSSSCGSSSRNFSEEEEDAEDDDDDDDGCLDDWEAIADALIADEDKKNHNPNSKHASGSDVNLEILNKECEIGSFNSECNKKVLKRGETCRAWRPDDAFRPQSLPNLAKQYSFPMNSERLFGHGGGNWGCQSFTSQPSSCPICCEDLDPTDTSFLPCLCGFRLCLFCHKRIMEGDGRCPGCRKKYDSGNEVAAKNDKNGGALQFRFARSVSMNT